MTIKGECASACVRYMKLPKVCAAKGAVFAFHAIWIKDEANVQPEDSYADSLATDTPLAFELEKRYDTFHMGVSKTRPYRAKRVEPGVRIVYDEIDYKGGRAYQVMLKVDAVKLIPACKR